MNSNNNSSTNSLCTQDDRLSLTASPSSQENPSLVSLLARSYQPTSAPGFFLEDSSEERNGQGLSDILSTALDILDDSPFQHDFGGSNYDDVFACPKTTASRRFKDHSSPRQ